ncbi:hypothetical protein, partial [Gilliamella intestini]|uniref:hypothetical protein n=1 Tax=Gilliamella intestini TaxID=1798183 RepID=UPI001ADF2129
ILENIILEWILLVDMSGRAIPDPTTVEAEVASVGSLSFLGSGRWTTSLVIHLIQATFFVIITTIMALFALHLSV